MIAAVIVISMDLHLVRRGSSMIMATVLATALAAVAFTACGTDPEPNPLASGTTAIQGDSSVSTTSTVEAATTETTAASSLATTTSATVTPSSAGTTGLPGEPFELFVEDGDELMVVGVAHDDVLNVRAAPGTDQTIVVELDPVAEQIEATGRGRQLSSTIWYEVRVGAVTGWSNSSYLAFGGSVVDATAEIIDQLGYRPATETMLELGTLIAEARSSSDVDSRIVLSVEPTVGDLGEVTYDVLGLADDALYGYRLHVFGQPLESGEGFSLGSVEQTSLCGRGVSDDGLCL